MNIILLQVLVFENGHGKSWEFSVFQRFESAEVLETSEIWHNAMGVGKRNFLGRSLAVIPAEAGH